ncbi:MAG TPA: superoxide dismutase [Thermodesulfobacteriota bacterium]|nr:superoxide dismutase [Thermodesulfobacteriota bacterium]
MTHQAKKFDLTLDGISEKQISQHRDILYAGYVNKLNEIEEKLKTADITKANQAFSEFRALKVEESFALNGVVLHELYFENLGVKSAKPTGKLSDLMARDFGSFDKWIENLKACGMAARGWVILGLCTYDGKLHNYCLDAHNDRVPVNVVPILVLDVYEHAYVIDFGVKRAPYLDAFVKNINWDAAAKRLDRVNLDLIAKEAAS